MLWPVLIACQILIGSCFVFVDAKSPYATEAECRVRLDEGLIYIQKMINNDELPAGDDGYIVESCCSITSPYTGEDTNCLEDQAQI